MLPPPVLVGLLAASLSYTLGLVTLFAAPGRRENRLLALLLFFEGSVALGASVALVAYEPTPDLAGFAGVFAVSIAALPALYLLLLRDLATPLARPLRVRGASFLVGVAGLVLVGANVVWPPYPYENDLTRFTYRVLMVASVLGLALAADAWRRAAPNTLARRRARLFALAFGTRDLVFVAFMLSAMNADGMGARVLGIPLPFYGTLLFAPLLAYALLRAQVLGIELVLKGSIRRGLVLATFLLVFLAVSEGVERFLAARYGPAAGLGAAAALAFAVRPLDRIAQRAADAAMPDVARTDAYLEARRLELYRAAVESALESGDVGEKERQTLARLREKLGLRPDDARAVEVDAGVTS